MFIFSCSHSRRVQTCGHPGQVQFHAAGKAKAGGRKEGEGQGGAKAWQPDRPAQEEPCGEEAGAGLGCRKPHHLQGPHLPSGFFHPPLTVCASPGKGVCACTCVLVCLVECARVHGCRSVHARRCSGGRSWCSPRGAVLGYGAICGGVDLRGHWYVYGVWESVGVWEHLWIWCVLLSMCLWECGCGLG